MRTKPFIFLLFFYLMLESASSGEKTSGKILTISDIEKNDRPIEKSAEEEDKRSFFVKYLSIFIVLAILVAALISLFLH